MKDARRAAALELLRPYIDRAQSFSGWSFEDLAVTPLDAPPPWDYVAIARERAHAAARVLDIGTGGGEVLSRIVEGLRCRVTATEEWHVNAPIARLRLRPLGADVVRAQSLRMPFRDDAFDLILDRHEELAPAEVARVLAPGGMFITQQVDSRQWHELDAFFPDRASFPDHFVDYGREFEALGLEVQGRRHDWRAAYAGIGEVAFMLMVAPWEVPGFDPVRDVDRLLSLEDAHGGEQGIVLTLSRYLMTARKPA